MATNERLTRGPARSAEHACSIRPVGGGGRRAAGPLHFGSRAWPERVRQPGGGLGCSAATRHYRYGRDMASNWRRSVASFVGGEMVANSTPHLASGATGRSHLVPLAGGGASPATSLAWGTANPAAGLALTPATVRVRPTVGPLQWNRSRLLFESGVAALSMWMLASESLLRVDTGMGKQEPSRSRAAYAASWVRGPIGG